MRPGSAVRAGCAPATTPGNQRWVRLEPGETGFVDLRCPEAGGQGLLGQVDGRSSVVVTRWLAGRSEAFRDGVQIVAVDPSAPYAAAVRDALPAARVAVDHFHLVALANAAVTAVRQRVTREQLGRRGRRRDPVWANRRLLLRGRERLSSRAMTRMCKRRDRPRTHRPAAGRQDRQKRTPPLTGPRRPQRTPRRGLPSALGVLPLVRRHRRPRTAQPRRDHRDLVARGRGVPGHRHHQRPHRGHQPPGQTGQARRLRIPQPRQLPHPSTVALHSINTTVRSVNQPAAHSRSVSVSLRCSGKEDHQARRR